MAAAFNRDNNCVDRFVEEYYMHVGPKYNGADTPHIPLKDIADAFINWQKLYFAPELVTLRLVAGRILSLYFRNMECLVRVEKFTGFEIAYLDVVIDHVPR